MRRALTACLCALLLMPLGALAEDNQQDLSPAERLLFMTSQLQGIKAPAQLRYSFKKTGTHEEGFTDNVTLALSASADGGCCNAKGTFLTGLHQEQMPDVEAAKGNPVLLYFLEHDVREMKRLTGGSEYHFRKTIRMAIYQGAQVRDASFEYQGHAVKGQEVVFSPFLDDPNRPRYEKFVRKSYRFMLSQVVPGGVFGIRTEIPGEKASDPPLIVEELYLEGAQPPSASAAEPSPTQPAS
jgi:hypothetical protein